ncbi:SHOCT domain-containing protein [Actinokineospora guangxiensis]|uniref:SHOCT domain-containing protein n=1 Tax=Actinokineospora guangxiensis TaxID=1490288 RepID=A0ABW0EGW5_9PSEU
MSWQDELQQLDSALAAGQLSADEYRSRRDALLSKAAGQSGPAQPPPQQQQPPEAERTQYVQPITGPPPGQHAGGPPPGGQADRTQAVRPEQHSDRTQVVSGHDASSDRTQIVSTSHVAPPPPPNYAASPPPWESVHPTTGGAPSTPWGSDDLPAGFGNSGWPRQGPEIFAEPDKGKGKVALIAVAVVLVLALAGGAVWFFGFSGDDSADPGTPPPTTTSKQEPVLPPPNVPSGPFIEIVGREALNRTMTIDQALQRKLPTERESKLMQANGVVEIGGLVTEENGMRRGLWAFKVGDGKDASAALVAMDALYEQAKYEEVDSTDYPDVVIRKLAAADKKNPTVFRAHYVADGGYMVRVEAFGLDAEGSEKAFFELLAAQTEKFPPLK